MRNSLTRNTTLSSRSSALIAIGLLSSLLSAATASADTSAAPANSTAPTDSELIQLEPFRVEAEAESDYFVQGPFLPDVQGTKLNVGKKTTILDFDALPRITGNNYRQALSEAPGLILSEETSPLLSIGYRGLDPNRAQFMQVLKDGIPIHADQVGYPEAYYAPPLDTVDRIEFIRGGASLMYGPQPGGALNYVTHRPRLDRPFAGSTLHTVGSDDYYSTFNYIDGTVGRVGYYGYYNHRESDGIRSANSDYTLDAWLGRVAIDADKPSRWLLTVETYEEEHGEPGGLTFAPASQSSAQNVNYLDDRRAPSRLNDRFNLERHAASLAYEHDFAHAAFTARAWYVDYLRASLRQRGGGFGSLPTGTTANSNTIERQTFDTYGFDSRVRLDWGAKHQHAFTVGGQLYHTDSPRTDSLGASANATTGVVQTQSDRAVFYAPVFAENLFRFGPLAITPGIRVETIYQDIVENINVAKQTAGTPLGFRKDSQTVPLLGLAVAYDLPAKSQLYFNVSESYRPMIFTQAVPNGATTIVNSDLKEGRALQYELGYRARPARALVLEASIFHLTFKDQVGNISLTTPAGSFTSVGNVGRAVHRGAELSAHYDLIAAFREKSDHKLELYANALLLDAEFKSTALLGKTPAQAPDHVIRTGLIYSHKLDFKLALTGTLTDDAFADDNNSAARAIPAYAVWDLTAEWRTPWAPVRLIGGINNVFDEDYYNRITAGGIDPAPRRNYYLGASYEF